MVIEVKKSLSERAIKEYRDGFLEKMEQEYENGINSLSICGERNPETFEFAEKLKNEDKNVGIRGEQNLITPELVAFELYSLYLKCMQEIPVLTKDKETGKQVPTGVYQFDARSALKALQLLGDAVGLFKDKSNAPAETQTYEDFLKSGGFDYEF